MISIYKNTDTGLVKLAEPVNSSWICAVDPNPIEIAWLQELGIPNDYITYPLDLDERPRSERENGELLILLRIPYFQGLAVDVLVLDLPVLGESARVVLPPNVFDPTVALAFLLLEKEARLHMTELLESGPDYVLVRCLVQRFS